MTAQKRSRRLFKLLLMVFLSIIQLYPLLWMLSSSFKPNAEIFQNLSLIPQTFTLENYSKGWGGVSGIGFGAYLWNTFFLSVLCIAGNLFSCSLAAYAFGRLNFRFKNLLFAVMFSTIMLPSHVVMIPQYIIYTQFNWINTYLPLIVPKFFATDVFFIYLMTQFIRGLPKELDQAAIVDGCGRVQVFYKIILPLIVPAIATTSIFTFIWTWNDFMTQLIYINTPHKFTVSQGLRAFVDASSQSSYGALFAMSVVSLLPVFFIFLIFQKYLVDGIATTGMKG